jgi:Tat protein translocase TatB subunit
MFGIGGQELLFILVLALIILGPSKLPEIARTLGKVMGEFNRATDDLKREIDLAAQEPPKPPAGAPGTPAPEVKPEEKPQDYFKEVREESAAEEEKPRDLVKEAMEKGAAENLASHPEEAKG